MLDSSKIDKSIPVPLYYQLKELLLNEIKNGNYKKDELIPTENELGEIFGISRTTIRQAITELVNEGWLYRIKSKGTFVSHPKISQDFIQRIEPFNCEMQRLGKKPRTDVLSLKKTVAIGPIAENLKIPENEDVIFLHRIRYADDEPIVEIKTYLPYKSCNFILEHDFVKESLYSILNTVDNVRVLYIRRRIEAVTATSEDARHLKIAKGKPILLVESVGYSATGEAIELSIARYRGDRSNFNITVAP